MRGGGWTCVDEEGGDEAFPLPGVVGTPMPGGGRDREGLRGTLTIQTTVPPPKLPSYHENYSPTRPPPRSCPPPGIDRGRDRGGGLVSPPR